jgi:hypothetical protein
LKGFCNAGFANTMINSTMIGNRKVVEVCSFARKGEFNHNYSSFVHSILPCIESLALAAEGCTPHNVIERTIERFVANNYLRNECE